VVSDKSVVSPDLLLKEKKDHWNTKFGNQPKLCLLILGSRLAKMDQKSFDRV
jgi:hypothetical protein